MDTSTDFNNIAAMPTGTTRVLTISTSANVAITEKDLTLVVKDPSGTAFADAVTGTSTSTFKLTVTLNPCEDPSITGMTGSTAIADQTYSVG